MTLPTITPAEAGRRVDAGSAIVIDIREPMEHAREAIPGARLHSQSAFNPAALSAMADANAPALIFHCQSGKRTSDNVDRLHACTVPEAYIMEGGGVGRTAAPPPPPTPRTKPIELQRQVQITAGLLVLTGLLLSWYLSPLFLGLSGFIGAALVFAGVSGWCGMARVLGAMPWNRMSA
jgi:rhodanese-related sulfurtransferase